ncbi:MAG: hypothetical protein QOJ32_2110 [Frankiaceae bacterium]|nr:hypothetical protein [Frankiaceae bacterium]MDQ1635301.1 hypothetical protein [Frankiaceae bacterium]MDQ1648434.1 hypothetical protein [Frankiaceae bacterium]MDQ1671593.1 hypothetical protein [Frankiaceae bacterium]
MGRRRTGPTMAERARNNGPVRDEVADPSHGTEVAADLVPGPAALRPAAVHHCWVDDAPGHPGRHPGLLLEWRREQQRWLGLVAYVMPDLQSDRVRLVQRWLPGVYLTPIQQRDTGPLRG